MTLRAPGLLALLAIALSCVPAAAVRDPRGAAGAIVTPSAASRGEPFVTSDGWTVRIEALALVATVTAGPGESDAGAPIPASGLEGGAFLWNGAERTELVVRAIRVGPVALTMALQGRRSGNKAIEISSFENLHRDPTIPPRLSARPDMFDFKAGPPSYFIAVRAEKAARVVVFDLTVQGVSSEVVHPIDVRADEVAFFSVEVTAEQLFIANASTGSSSFDEIASADSNADGHLTIDELKAAAGNQGSVYERLAARGSRLLVPR